MPYINFHRFIHIRALQILFYVIQHHCSSHIVVTAVVGGGGGTGEGGGGLSVSVSCKITA